MGTRKKTPKTPQTLSIEERVDRLEIAVFGETRRYSDRSSFFDLRSDKPSQVQPFQAPRAPALKPLPTDDQALATLYLTTAAKEDRRWTHGADTVFISHLIERLQQAGFDADPARVKASLVALHRAGYLSLSRADLVEAMKAEDVNASETRYLNAEFHFIKPDKPPRRY